MNLKLICLSGLLLIMLPGCGLSVFSGGADYRYERYDPATNATISVVIHSTREVGSAVIHFSPDGAVDVDVQSIKPGPNNLGQALSIIDNLTGIIMAVP